jgi:hypothetical protein
MSPETGVSNSAGWRLAWPRLDASLATPYDEEFIVRKRNALQQQGISLLTIEVQPQDINIH